MKICNRCQVPKEESEFSAKRTGLQPYCKPCQAQYQRDWYERNKERHKENVGRRNAKLYQEMRRVIEERKSVPCTDCKRVYHPWQMDFDHLRDKQFDVSTAAGRSSLARLIQEIEKCEVVCANCHRDRTYRRN